MSALLVIVYFVITTIVMIVGHQPILEGYEVAKAAGAEPGTTWYWGFKNVFYVVMLYFFVIAIPFVAFSLIYQYRKREREEGEHASKPWGSVENGLLIAWAVAVFAGDIFLDFVSESVFEFQKKIPENAMEIEVIGSMWMWQFKYPNGKTLFSFYNPATDKFEDFKGGFIVPAGTPIKLAMKSTDVIHSLYLWPPIQKLQDLYPGRITYQWFKVDAPGEYLVSCREYCGTNHAFMLAKIWVVPKEEFEKWYNGELADADIINKYSAKKWYTKQAKMDNIKFVKAESN